MNRLRIAMLAIICPLLFSCGQRSGIKTEEAVPSQETVNEKPLDEKNKTQEWAIDPASSQIKFTIKNMGLKVDGTISGLRGQILFDTKDLEHSKFEVEADISTISTGIEKRDKDIMEEKFFDQKKFPYIVFHSDSIIRNGNEYLVAGDFMMKGAMQHRRVPFTFEQSPNACTFKSSFMMNRLDFGIGGKGPVMGTEVNVNVEIVTAKK